MTQLTRRFVAVALIFAIALSSMVVAHGASPVSDGTYTRTLTSGSSYSIIAKLIVDGGLTRYSAAFSGTKYHTSGNNTPYTCTQTQTKTQGATGSIEGSSYGSTFTSMANSVGLYQTAPCSFVAGTIYYISASAPSGTYGFRAVFPGATIYENVDQHSSSGVTSLFYHSVTYVPSRTNVAVEPYKIG